MHRIKVATGHYVDLLDPDPATIDVNSIAVGLSKLCRFGGQCPVFYSVAEHSVLATDLAIQDQCADCECLAVLFHDATEAFIGDVVRPLKLALPAYRDIESRWELAIGRALGIDFAAHRDVISRIDLEMLKAEKQFFWPNDRTEWEGLEGVQSRNVVLSGYMPQWAEFWFRHLFRTLSR